MPWFKPKEEYKLLDETDNSTADDYYDSTDEDTTLGNKYKIKNYIENIYKFLGDKYCFVSGAFVIQDDQQHLLTLLQSVKNHSLKMLGTAVIYSHTKYKAPGQEMYEIHFSDKYNFILNCKCTGLDEHIYRPVRNIKWYPFNANGNNYIYLKLENYATKTLGHLLEAKDRYGKGKKIACVKSRREDCDKEKETGEQCRYKDAETNKPFESPEKIIINGVEHIVLETHGRKGDEAFIPQVLNDYLIDNNDMNLLFNYNADNNSVSIQSKLPSGGSRKRSTIRKRSTNRKRSTIRKRSTTRNRKRTTKFRKRTTRKIVKAFNKY